ncbi:MAG: hypothetical protein ACK4UQ_00795 [Brevundimonas sp.]
MTKLLLKDVFTPGGLPSVTYVGREHLELEKKISNARAKGFAFNVVTGPTKSGKSVLCHKVLSDRKLVVVEGGQIKTEDDFWKHVAFHLNIASIATKGRADTSTGTVATEGSVGVPAVLGGKLTGTQSESGQDSSSLTYNNVSMLASINKLIDSGTALLVDDFHYLDPGVQKGIIQSLKGAVFKGLTVFLLAVPHRAFDPITVENEVEGRFKHIEIPEWTLEDLKLIPSKGEPALRVKFSKSTVDEICAEAFGNPLLVQEACSEFCLANEVYETQDSDKKLDDKLLGPAFTAIAQSKGFPKFEKLKKGPNPRKERQPRNLKSGTTADIYSVIMSAIASLGPKPKTKYDEIRSAMKDILADSEQMPQKNEITSALSHMTKIAKEKIQGEPPLEWVRGDDVLVITDPFLLFYMKWAINEARAPAA